MDGHVIEERLLAYYFGASSDEDGGAIDAHLCACTACLRAFLDLKRHIEHGGDPEVRPRPATRERLRESVGRAFRPSAATRFRRALRRPVPLYQSLAVAAFAATVAVLAPFARGLAREAPPSGEHVDTARLSAESLTIY
jgi:anti-sigma factor RsiW